MCEHNFIVAIDNIGAVKAEVDNLKNVVNNAYDERNIMVLVTALLINDNCQLMNMDAMCGWYNDENGEEGFKRIISLSGGKYTFHVPDNFNMGRLPIIKPNWDGHTTEEKYRRLRDYCND